MKSKWLYIVADLIDFEKGTWSLAGVHDSPMEALKCAHDGERKNDETVRIMPFILNQIHPVEVETGFAFGPNDPEAGEYNIHLLTELQKLHDAGKLEHINSSIYEPYSAALRELGMEFDLEDEEGGDAS